MLFLELALIRWLGANVVHLSYFSNFVLLGSFLGIGAGFLISRKSWSIWPASLPLLTALVVAVLTFPVTIQRSGSDVIYFTSLEVDGPPAWVALPVVFVLVAVILAGPAELVGPLLRPAAAPLGVPLRPDRLAPRHRGLHRAELPADAVGGLGRDRVPALRRAGPRARSGGWSAVAFSVVVVGMLLMETMATGVSWSPYYKVTTEEVGTADDGFLLIKANGVPHQLMAPAQWKLEQGERIYATPYLRLPDNALGDVLVVGAGSGSDVAIALREGARHVDAVDIDPRILEIGAESNIDRPYANDGVDVHTNDGRAFLEGADRTYYDLILFALPDSLTLVSGASQIRLESFLFTEEAMTSVRDHLKPDGAFAMYNYYRENWLVDRLAGTAAGVFGHAPCVDTFGGAAGGDLDRDDRGGPAVRHDLGALGHRAGRRPGDRRRAVPLLQGRLVPAALHDHADRHPADVADRGARPRRPAARDAALRRPVLHGCRLPAAGDQERRDVRAAVRHHLVRERAGLRRRAGRRARGGRDHAPVPHPAATGGLRRHRRLPRAGLGGPARVAARGCRSRPRLVAATLIAFLPIYLANVAFAKRFADSADSQSAFAINLLGAIVGGCLEYAALVIGYNNLLIVTGLLYLVAFLLIPRGAVRVA